MVQAGLAETVRDVGDGPLHVAVAPVTAGGRRFGALTVRRAVAPFDDDEMALLAVFADGVSDALTVSNGRDEIERLRVLEVRQQIARDLHDEVIQDLIGVRLALDGIVHHTADPVVADQVRTLGDELTSTTKRLRDVVAGVETATPVAFGDSLRSLISSRARRQGIGWNIRLDGPVDTIVDDERADVLRVVNEALSNVVRHADATQVDLTVCVDDTRLELLVEDDGVGPAGAADATGMGLRNLRARARARAGECRLAPRSDGGSSLVWWIPRSSRRGPTPER